MRLPKFKFVQPETVAEAARILTNNGPEAMLLAGGTDLFPKMKRRQFEPKVVVGMHKIAGLRGIQGDPTKGVTLGALTTLTDLQADGKFAAAYPVVARAAGVISTPILQNMGTVGGNLCVDTRCNYYDMPYPWRQAVNFCMKKDGEECLVAPGSSRCWAVSSSDLAPVMVAIGAQVKLVSSTDGRTIPVQQLYGKDGINYLAKKPNEILTEVQLPAVNGWKATYWKLRRRGAFDFPILGVAAWTSFDSKNAVKDARLVLGAVESMPIEVPEVADALRGKKLTDETISAAIEPAVAKAKPLHNVDLVAIWRKGMVRHYVKGALRELAGLGGNEAIGGTRPDWED